MRPPVLLVRGKTERCQTRDKPFLKQQRGRRQLAVLLCSRWWETKPSKKTSHGDSWFRPWQIPPGWAPQHLEVFPFSPAFLSFSFFFLLNPPFPLFLYLFKSVLLATFSYSLDCSASNSVELIEQKGSHCLAKKPGEAVETWASDLVERPWPCWKPRISVKTPGYSLLPLCSVFLKSRVQGYNYQKIICHISVRSDLCSRSSSVQRSSVYREGSLGFLPASAQYCAVHSRCRDQAQEL